MSNATQAANWGGGGGGWKLANITLEALLEVMTNCLLNLKWAATPKSTATASVWLARVLVSRNEIAFWLRETSHVWSPSPLGPHSSACIACINYDDFRRSFSEAPCGQGGGPAQVKLTGYSMTQKNTECWGLTMFTRHFLNNTLHHSTLCASISQSLNQLPKHSKVRCKEEEKCNKIICKTQNRDLPPSGSFSQKLSHIVTYAMSHMRWFQVGYAAIL